jgi:hypothetical protein
MSQNDQGFLKTINLLSMLKTISNLGKALNGAEQKKINGGIGEFPYIETFPSDPSGGWIDDSPEDCNYPYEMRNGRCQHMCNDFDNCN